MPSAFPPNGSLLPRALLSAICGVVTFAVIAAATILTSRNWIAEGPDTPAARLLASLWEWSFKIVGPSIFAPGWLFLALSSLLPVLLYSAIYFGLFSLAARLRRPVEGTGED